MSQNYEQSLIESYQDIDKGLQLLVTYMGTLLEYVTLLKDKLGKFEKIHPRPSQPQQQDLPSKYSQKKDQVPKETIQLRRLEKHCIKCGSPFHQICQCQGPWRQDKGKKKEMPTIFTSEFQATLQRILEECKQREEEKEYEEIKKSFQQREQFWERVEEDTDSPFYTQLDAPPPTEEYNKKTLEDYNDSINQGNLADNKEDEPI
ncbi:hypothetical protein RSAG8_08942, partial [Rhizoctonia solani AG-8 WAC10335]